jgi:hypothetical protein
MASPGNPSDPLSGAGTTETQGTTQSQSGAEAAQGEHLTERARKKAGEMMHQAEESARGMAERARSAADQQKDAAAGSIEGVAQALRSASDDLEHRGQPMVAQYSRQVAEGLESMATWVSRRNIDDLVGGIEDFARQRPVAFMGGAMVAGFALARFMKSSSARRSRPGGSDYGREYRGTSGSYGQGMRRRSEYGGAVGTSGSYDQGRPERSEYGGAAGTSGSFDQDMSRRGEYGGGSTATPASPGQGTPTPPASAGTRPTESPGRSTEGGI